MPKAKLSKFNYGVFVDGSRQYVAVSMQRYTFEEAVRIASEQLGVDYSNCSFAYNEAWVMHRAGVDEDGNKIVGWWMENIYRPRCCPCWIFPARQYEDFISNGNVCKFRRLNDG